MKIKDRPFQRIYGDPGDQIHFSYAHSNVARQVNNLFYPELDTKDYDISGKAFIRPSVRGIIIRSGKVAMVHSIKYDYYKFPGGGIENGENHIDD